jgi:acetolactate synthase-1/2/3 large subunit
MQTRTIRHLSAALIETSPDGAASAGVNMSGHGERVETTEDFAPALDRALAADGPALIHVLIDPATIPPAADETS